MATSIYAALSALMLIFLSLRVIEQRRKNRVSVGSGDSPELERAMRCQANFVEYTPLALILLALAEMQGAAVWVIHLLGAAFLAARIVHFIGFHSREAPMMFRVGGMAATFGILLVLAILVVARYVAIAWGAST